MAMLYHYVAGIAGAIAVALVVYHIGQAYF